MKASKGACPRRWQSDGGRRGTHMRRADGQNNASLCERAANSLLATSCVLPYAIKPCCRRHARTAQCASRAEGGEEPTERTGRRGGHQCRDKDTRYGGAEIHIAKEFGNHPERNASQVVVKTARGSGATEGKRPARRRACGGTCTNYHVARAWAAPPTCPVPVRAPREAHPCVCSDPRGGVVTARPHGPPPRGGRRRAARGGRWPTPRVARRRRSEAPPYCDARGGAPPEPRLWCVRAREQERRGGCEMADAHPRRPRLDP